jgi:hypothetical protein
MALFKYINLPIFFASLLFGLFAVYILIPDMRKIYVYPTPENVDILLYRDKTGQCFRFAEKEVVCPTDASKMAKLPVQA